MEEKQEPRWIENCTAKESARLHHKFDNARGSDRAQAVAVELDTAETILESAGRVYPR